MISWHRLSCSSTFVWSFWARGQCLVKGWLGRLAMLAFVSTRRQRHLAAAAKLTPEILSKVRFDTVFRYLRTNFCVIQKFFNARHSPSIVRICVYLRFFQNFASHLPTGTERNTGMTPKPVIQIWHPWHLVFWKRHRTQNHVFWAGFAYAAPGMSSYEKFLQKLFFQKVQMILNNSTFYHLFISLILLKLSYIEDAHKKLNFRKFFSNFNKSFYWVCKTIMNWIKNWIGIKILFFFN